MVKAPKQQVIILQNGNLKFNTKYENQNNYTIIILRLQKKSNVIW